MGQRTDQHVDVHAGGGGVACTTKTMGYSMVLLVGGRGMLDAKWNGWQKGGKFIKKQKYHGNP